MPPVEFEDLLAVDGQDNTSGLAVDIYVAKIDDILTLPEPVLNDSTGSGKFADLVTISGDIQMKPGKYFRKIQAIIETAKLDGTLQGEMDGKSSLNRLDFTLAGNKADALGFQQWAKNGSLVFIVQDQDGKKRILGHRAYPAKFVEGVGTTGAASTERKQITFAFQSVRKGAAPYFTGRVLVNGVGSVDVNADLAQDIYPV